MNGPPGCDASEAVPRRTKRPDVVVGRAVPGLPPRSAVATRCFAVPVRCPVPRRVLPVMGRELVPGRAKPVVGLPDCVSGRKPAVAPVGMCGRLSDVPGLGAACTALSSRSMSPAPAARTM